MTDMSCPEFADLHRHVASSAASATPDARIAAHLQSCDACRATAAEIADDERAWDDMRAVLRARDPAFAERIPGYRVEAEIPRGGQALRDRVDEPFLTGKVEQDEADDRRRALV